jgi:hypothetical protein
MLVRVQRTFMLTLAAVITTAAAPAVAFAASVVTITDPADGATYYTGQSSTAAVSVGATLSTDCNSGTWQIVRGPPGTTSASSVTGGTTSTGQLQTTNNLLPGDYEYAGSVTCVDPSSDTFTTNRRTIHVIQGNPPSGKPPDTTPPAGSASGKTQRVGSTVAIAVGSNEACTAKVTGIVVLSRPTKTYALVNATRSIAAGQHVMLQLSIPKAAASAIRKALRKHRGATARLTIVLTDTAGNASKLTKTVKLKL